MWPRAAGEAGRYRASAGEGARLARGAERGNTLSTALMLAFHWRSSSRHANSAVPRDTAACTATTSRCISPPVRRRSASRNGDAEAREAELAALGHL